MKKKESVLLAVILFLLLVGIFYSTGPDMRELTIFTVLSALLLFVTFLVRYYYVTDQGSLKHRVIFPCICFINVTVYYVAVKELTGFSLDDRIIHLFLLSSLIFTLWELLDLTLLEKGVLILTLAAILAVSIYEGTVTTPSTAAQFYHSELREATAYEDFKALLLDDSQRDFTLEDFQNLEPYLQQFPLAIKQPALFEFKDGQMLLVEVSREDNDKPLRISNITLLPEEIASYFRYYPLEMERKADFPLNRGDDKAIIETRGAFISRANFYQERDWYEQLISVFGKREVWDNLWEKLEGMRAPGGPVAGFGTNNEGYLEFIFGKNWEVEQEVLDKIYEVFQIYAAEHNITALPVVFKWHQNSE